jgi:hypothetical protein
MNKKQLIVVGLGLLLLSGCVGIQDRSIKNDSSDVRVSGDVTVSARDRKSF